jgi:hypothetical protein
VPTFTLSFIKYPPQALSSSNPAVGARSSNPKLPTSGASLYFKFRSSQASTSSKSAVRDRRPLVWLLHSVSNADPRIVLTPRNRVLPNKYLVTPYTKPFLPAYGICTSIPGSTPVYRHPHRHLYMPAIDNSCALPLGKPDASKG